MTPRPDSTYPLVMKPYKLDISQFGEKIRNEEKITIKNVSDQDWIVTNIDSPKAYFNVKLPKVIEAGKSADIIVTLTELGITDDFEKSFTLEVNDSQTTRYTIPVKRKHREIKPKS